MRLLLIGLVAVVLANCGGGGSSPVTMAPEPPMEPVQPMEPEPPAEPEPDPDPEPVTPEPMEPDPQTNIDFPLLAGNIAYAGIHQSVSGNYPTQSLLGDLPEVGQRGQTTIRYGTLDDGAGRSLVEAYMNDVALHGDEVSRFTSAPTVRVVAGANARERRIVAEAVEAINLSLPAQFQIRLGPDVPDPDAFEDGTIDVLFLSCAEFRRCGSAAASTAVNTSRDANGEQTRRTADVLFARGTNSYSRDDEARTLMAHELMHALGIDHHVQFWLSSIMQSGNHHQFATPSVLTALDREALAVLYRRLDPGDGPGDFGPWSAQSTHLAGNGAHANFGVAMRNGYAESWAHGPTPTTTLADNRALSGSATWVGTLLGFSGRQAVAGDAAVSVTLATLAGRADFTSLEAWAPNAAPGAVGTGTTWLDGDLGYTIAVAGNTFRRTGGDDGTLTGIFTGAAHEGAAGTLERADLTAAFGASR